MLVHVEAVGQVADGRATVRVRSEAGAAVAFWCGDPTAVGREHHVEWTVEEDVAWGVNTRPATSYSPGVDEEEDGRIVFRGQLSLTGDGGAVLQVAGTLILFDLAEPPPSTAVDGTLVEISVERTSVSLWPYLL
ncbi:hypothetical protein [Streptomyces sp. NBC_00654]|uniref:hypothetical protein n=1 Tax=Streptomyces sp. NBC_00654 TaxID=2975799 RepID=UPI00225990E0|nr:hypothetical protein [Streptomyces sp. NBC_00654]MCX4970970.1 hypothetical protein [Streptomyces sp. NBC_00654]